MAMDVVRIYTGDDGKSHFEDITIDVIDFPELMGRISDPEPVTALQFREVDGNYDLDYHNAPRRQYVVNLSGSCEVETGHGEVRRMGPGSVLLAEDLTGQGHLSRNVGGEPRTCLFIHL